MKKPIRILLADDHQIVRNGIKLMLEHQNTFTPVIKEATNGQEVIDIAETNEIDVFLLDISMPILDGIATLKTLKELNLKNKVIIFTMHNEEHYINLAIENGALGYVLKQSGLDELIDAIQTVSNGETYFCEGIRETAELIINKGKSGSEELTDREMEILKLIASELTNQEVADILKISKRTVEGHRMRLIDKLNVKGTVGLVKYAIQRGII